MSAEALAQQLPQAHDGQFAEVGGRSNLLHRAKNYGVALLATAGIGVGLSAEAMLVDPASAHADSIPADVFDWSHVGGAPLVPGGIHSLGAAKAFLESPKGHSTLKREGLNSAERSAVEKAVHAGKLHGCTIPANKLMLSMVSANMELDHNVVLDDPNHPDGVPGYCVTATRIFTRGHHKVKETINDGVAGPCGNGVFLSESFTSIKPKRTHKPEIAPVAPVEVFKIALDDQGHQLIDNEGHAVTPTGTFRFEATCKDGRNTVDSVVTYDHSPQSLVECNVGSTVTVTELPTLGNEQWAMLSPETQSMIVDPENNKFVFKDQELAPSSPPPPPPSVCPPNTNLENVNGTEQCVTPKDGTQGAGTGTPGQPGGPGAGGQPGNSGGSGETCIDPADSTDGDMNPATQGDIMYGTHDQFGYCVGQAQPLQNS